MTLYISHQRVTIWTALLLLNLKFVIDRLKEISQGSDYFESIMKEEFKIIVSA